MPPTAKQPDLPKVKVSPRGATRLKSGHVWVYRSDLLAADAIPPGSLVTVTDQRDKPISNHVGIAAFGYPSRASSNY